jgi:hypothetical protein
MAQGNIPVDPNDDPTGYFTNSNGFFGNEYTKDLQHARSPSRFNQVDESSQQQSQTYRASSSPDQPMPTIEEDVAQNTGNGSYPRPSRNMTIDDDYDDEGEDDAPETSQPPNVHSDPDTPFDGGFDWLTDLQSTTSPEYKAESYGTSQTHDTSNFPDSAIPQVNSSPTHAPNQQAVASVNASSCSYGPDTYGSAIEFPGTQYVPPYNPGLQRYSYPLARAMMSSPHASAGQTFPTNAQHGNPAAYGFGWPCAPSNPSIANARPYQLPFAAQPCYVPNVDVYMRPDSRYSFPQPNYTLPNQYYKHPPLQQQNHGPTNFVRPPTVAPVQANQPPSLPSISGPQNGLRRLYFTNLAHAKKALANRIMSSNTTWEPDTTDATIPYNNAEQAQYVCQLLSAMEDVTTAQDSIRHWQHDSEGTKVPYYHPSHVEKVCWVLVFKAVALHTRGPRTLATYDPSALRNARLEQSLTFAERIDAICALLRYSKSRCDRLMKGETFEIVIGAPQHLLGQSRMNKNQNEIKQSRLKKGVEMEKKQGSETCSSGAGDEEGATVVTLPYHPQKRAMESDDCEEETVVSTRWKRAKR